MTGEARLVMSCCQRPDGAEGALRCLSVCRFYIFQDPAFQELLRWSCGFNSNDCVAVGVNGEAPTARHACKLAVQQCVAENDFPGGNSVSKFIDRIWVVLQVSNQAISGQCV